MFLFLFLYIYLHEFVQNIHNIAYPFWYESQITPFSRECFFTPLWRTIKNCVKRVCIWSYSGPHFSQIFPHPSEYVEIPRLSVFRRNARKSRKNVDQNNSEYGHFLRSGGQAGSGRKDRPEKIIKKRKKNKHFKMPSFCAVFNSSNRADR